MIAAFSRGAWQWNEKLTYIERRVETRPEIGEAPFDVREVFFSRTDHRGIIKAGNYVFRRVANYDWHEMLDAPHRIIRHPDMPRGVFWLFWNQLKQGKAVGAYVKNRAQDGLHYWVFAVVAPNSDGFLSARVKPTSPMIKLIKQEYADLLLAEKEEKLSPEDSAKRLLSRLKELGFPEYDLFASHALSEELIARDNGIGQPEDEKIVRFRRVLGAAETLRDQTRGLIEEFSSMRTIPHNMRVIASRLEPTGGPVSTLSKNYGAISEEMSDWFEHHVVGEQSNFAAIYGSVSLSMFLVGMARILQECDIQLDQERRRLGEIDLEHERQILKNQVTEYTEKAQSGLSQVREEADRILRACGTMHRHVLGLSSTRVLCKIESGRTAGAEDGLEDIIRQLGVFQERISKRLTSIALESERILDLTG